MTAFSQSQLPKGPISKTAIISLLMGVFFALYMGQQLYLTEISGLDQSWHLMLTHAYKAHYQHGRDIIFNYGPLSFLVPAYYDLETAPIRAVLTTLYYASFGITLAHSLKIDSFVKAGISCLVFLPLYFFRDIHLLIPSLLLCQQEIARKPGDRAAASIAALLGVQMAFMSLIKSPGLVFAIPVLLLVSLYRFSRRDYLPIPLLAFIAGSALLLLVARQDYSAIVDFYLGYIDISRAYNADMHLSADWTPQAIYLAGGLLVLGSISPRAPGSLLRGLVFLGYLLVVYKINFVRHGAVPYHAVAGLAVALFCLLILPESRPRLPLHRLALGGAAAVSVLAAAHHGVTGLPTGNPLYAYAMTLKHSALMALDRGYSAAIRQDYQSQRSIAEAKVKQALPFKDMAGPIDVFPFEFSQAYASGLPIATRPAFQAYFATSRLMTEQNAAFLDSDRAPRSVLFSIAPLDLHYTAQEDPLTLRAYRRLYQVKDRAAGALLLERRPQPLIEQEVCRDTVTTLDQTLPLPPVAPDAALWIRIGLSTTWTGKIAGLFLPPPLLSLTVTTASTRNNYRYLQSSGEVGFLVSPTLMSLAEADRFFTGQAAPQDGVISLKLSAPEGLFFDWHDAGIPVSLCTLSWAEQKPL
jgi:hypothetical protein